MPGTLPKWFHLMIKFFSAGAAKAFTAEAMDFEMSAPMESVTQSETPSKRTPSQPDLQAHGESTVRTNAKDVPSGLSVPDSTILNVSFRTSLPGYFPQALFGNKVRSGLRLGSMSSWPITI